MSLTGFGLRKRLRSHIVTALDVVIDMLETSQGLRDEEPVPAAPAPAPVAAAPVPAPAPAPAAKPAPLPELPKVLKPTNRDLAGAASKPEPKPAPKEDKQAAHWQKTRLGVLDFVADQGGSASLREMHAHSEATYFVAHVSFSRLMEELTDEGLLDFDFETSVAALTDKGKAALS